MTVPETVTVRSPGFMSGLIDLGTSNGCTLALLRTLMLVMTIDFLGTCFFVAIERELVPPELPLQ